VLQTRKANYLQSDDYRKLSFYFVVKFAKKKLKTAKLMGKRSLLYLLSILQLNFMQFRGESQNYLCIQEQYVAARHWHGFSVSVSARHFATAEKNTANCQTADRNSRAPT
jgi:hypothetical protein